LVDIITLSPSKHAAFFSEIRVIVEILKSDWLGKFKVSKLMEHEIESKNSNIKGSIERAKRVVKKKTSENSNKTKQNKTKQNKTN